MSPAVRYRTVSVDGLPIFYRDAGNQDAPVLLLLHGLPSSSRMYEPLLRRLSDGHHLVAPDYPGFGHSAAPAPHAFAYTFDRIAEVVSRWTGVPVSKLLEGEMKKLLALSEDLHKRVVGQDDHNPRKNPRHTRRAPACGSVFGVSRMCGNLVGTVR